MTLIETPGAGTPAPAPGGAGLAHRRTKQAFLSEVATTENVGQGQGFDWRNQLHRLEPLALHLLPCGAGRESKAPMDPATGRLLRGWETATFTAAEISAAGRARSVGARTGEGVCCFDIDGATAVALCREHGCNPDQAPTWRVERDTDPARMKVIWQLDAEQRLQLGTVARKATTRWPDRDPEGGIIEKGQAVELYHHAGKQVILLGEHPNSGGNYLWPNNHGPEAYSPIPLEWWDLALAIAGETLGIGPERIGTAATADTSTIPRASSGSSNEWEPANPCPICRRNTTGYCSRNRNDRTIRCFHGSTFSPEISHGRLGKGDRVGGADGVIYGFCSTADQANGDRFSVFRVHQERLPVSTAAAVAAYNPASQQQEDSEGGKETVRATTYSDLISWTLGHIKEENEDGEMECRAELKQRFRLSDEQIETALFKRHSAENIKKTDAEHNSLDMESIEQLGYLMDGWIPKGDVVLTYGSYGTGKTTLAMAKMHAHVTGKNLLDRDTPCTPGRGLFIATDSGAAPLKKTMADLGMDPDTNPLMKPGHPDQRIWIWAHQPSQGHGSWICNIHGVIRLERFIRENQITYVVIDSAKSVSSAAGWSYTSNESVKALLQYLREGIAQPTGCCLEFLSHDGTEKGSHSGAKAWAEDPSMVVSLEAAIDPESKKFTGIVARFRKDRAAVVDARRELRYGLNDGQLERHPDVEVVSNCADALLTILWEAHRNGHSSLKGSELKAEALARFNRSAKTVDNSLGQLAGSGKGPTPTPVIRTGRGRYALAPAEIERRTAANPYRSPPLSGGICIKSIAAEGIYPLPIELPDGKIGKSENFPIFPSGISIGRDQTPAPDWDLPQIPPEGGEGRGVSEASADQPYESPERLADTREERLPQAAREERDADRLWLRQRGLTSTAPQPAPKAPGSAPPPWLATALVVRDLAPPGALPAVMVNHPDLEQWRRIPLTGAMVGKALDRFDAGEWPELRTQSPADQGGEL